MNVFVTLLTPEIGMVRARAQGVRRSGAKLASALTTFAESSFVLVRGKEGWRIAGAVLEENWFQRMQDVDSRVCAGRVCGLLLRLVAGEARDEELFPIVKGFFQALAELPEDLHEVVEILAALRVLAALGFDTGNIPGEPSVFTTTLLETVREDRKDYITRINRGITASEL
jgi:recombinational DNA repair protein (RecF pathway)